MPSQFTTAQYLAAKRAIELNIPFALIANPGDEHYSFFASYPDEEIFNEVPPEGPPAEAAFFISSFAAPLANGYIIRASLSADDILSLPASFKALPGPDITPQYLSTPYPYYYAKVREARDKIRKRQMKKVVLSRCINTQAANHPVDIADSYFALFPDTFRAIYFTQETGLWITATPELLAEVGSLMPDNDSDILVRSMSLAGTRSRTLEGNASSEEWDDKNLEEHDAVLDFITSTMKHYKLNTTVSEASTMPFGHIEHRKHIIEGRSTGASVNPYMLIDELSPTPALAGLPVGNAIKFIAQNEIHNRLSYGGLVGTISDSGIRLFVNIRCAMFSSDNNGGEDASRDVNIFAGGGIMGSSVASHEWVEAARKAMPLYSLLSDDIDPDAITEIPEGWRDLD